MFSPLPFPDWVPPWVHILALVVLAGVLLLFVLMPFSVFGLKSRLELIEARLDDIQAELRMIGQGQGHGQGQGQQQEYGQELRAELADDTGRVETLRAQLAGTLPSGRVPGQLVRAEPQLSKGWLRPPTVARERIITSQTGLP